MPAPTRKQFSPEAVAVSQIASVILSQPLNMTHNMTYNAACRHAFNLLVAADQFLEQREALVAAGKVSD
jgi:hypothetical protein